MSTLFALQIQISLAILLVLLLRCCMTRLPKRWSCGLWMIVFFRLLIPVSMESPLGILPGEEALDCMWQQVAGGEIQGFAPELRNPYQVSVESLAAREHHALISGNNEKAAEMETQEARADIGANRQYRYGGLTDIFVLAWFTGVLAVLGYNLYTMLRIRRKIRNAELLEEEVYLCPGLETPFTVGVLCPRIYLPAGLEPEERAYILCHERVHVRRRDYLVKGIAFLLTAFYWYNPLVWVAFWLLDQDMEMSCDEAVVRSMGNKIRRAYSQSLLDFAVGRKNMAMTPLAFGGNGVKQRVKNILRGKRSGLCGVLAGILVLTVAVVLVFTTSGGGEETSAPQKGQQEKTLPQSGDLMPDQAPQKENTSQLIQLIDMIRSDLALHYKEEELAQLIDMLRLELEQVETQE